MSINLWNSVFPFAYICAKTEFYTHNKYTMCTSVFALSFQMFTFVLQQ